MAGDKEPWCLGTSALDLTATQVVEGCSSRFRQAEAFRDHHPRLGREACRAWTKEPVRRTFQVPRVALTLLRVLQAHVAQAWGEGSWWLKPAWDRPPCPAAILDRRRRCWRPREECSKVLVALETWEQIPQPPGWGRNLTGMAA
jgi:hypothetical protein